MPMIGFSSGKYDFNLNKRYFVGEIARVEEGEICSEESGQLHVFDDR